MSDDTQPLHLLQWLPVSQAEELGEFSRVDQCRSVGLTDCLKVGDDNEAIRRPLALSVQCSRQCWKFVCVCASPRLGIGHAGDACTPSASLGASLAHFSSTLFLFPFYSLPQLNSDGVSSGKIFNEWRTTHSSLEGTNRKLTQPVRTVCVCVCGQCIADNRERGQWQLLKPQSTVQHWSTSH